MTATLEDSLRTAGAMSFTAQQDQADSALERRIAAEQFEGLFLTLMLKQMRSAGAIEGGLIDRDRLQFQQDLFDEELAQTLARGGGVGLADAILRSWSEPGRDGSRRRAGEALPLPAPAESSARSLRLAPSPSAMPSLSPVSAHGAALSSSPGRDIGRTALAATPDVAPISEGRRLATADPETFVAMLWPHAEQAGQTLGVAPDILVAQAALETGWGRRLPHDANGHSSLNLFGIKAGQQWLGRTLTTETLEYVGGNPERRSEAFRMYESVSESFADYVSLVRGSPRYRAALDASSGEDYLRALQQGGYATDPEYAGKILNILDRGLPGLSDAVASDAAQGAQGRFGRNEPTRSELTRRDSVPDVRDRGRNRALSMSGDPSVLAPARGALPGATGLHYLKGVAAYRSQVDAWSADIFVNESGAPAAGVDR